MSVDRFEYPDLGVVVQRGPMGQPSGGVHLSHVEALP